MPRKPAQARKRNDAREAADARYLRETNTRLAHGGRIRITDKRGRHLFMITMTPGGDGLEVRSTDGSLFVCPSSANLITVFATDD